VSEETVPKAVMDAALTKQYHEMNELLMKVIDERNDALRKVRELERLRQISHGN
jgi:hypothetical protein